MTLCLFMIFSFGISATDAASLSWFLGGGSTGADYAADVACVGRDIIFAASFVNTATFNGVTLTGAAKGSGSNYDKSLFIAKMNAEKANLWNIYSNVGVFNPVAIATDGSGSLFVTGSVRAVKNTASQTTTANIVDAAGTATTFTDLGNGAADVQAVVAKFNASGIVQWVKELNSSATKDTLVETTGLAVDEEGNVYITGVYTKTVIIPGTTPITLSTTNTTQGTFLAKLSGTNGDAVWAKTSSGGIISESFNALTVGSDGNLYVAGASKNLAAPIAVTFGGQSFTPSITPSLVLVKLDKNGNVGYLQSRAALSTNATKGDLRVKDILYRNGLLFVAGSFQGSYGGIQFAGGAMTATAAYLNGFITGFNATDGADLWQQPVTAPAIAELNGLAIGRDGYIWAIGYGYNALGTTIAAGDISFGNGKVLTDAANKLGDLFLASFAPATGLAGEVHWAGKSANSETANALFSNGDLYLAATTNSSLLTFETPTLTYATAGSFDFVLQKYSIPLTAIDEVRANAVSSYYDAASRSVVVKNAGEYASVSLYDLMGRKVGSSVVANSEVRISNLQQGVYVVSATKVNGSRVSAKVAVQ